jgi:putative transposase
VQYLPKVVLSHRLDSLKGVSSRALRHDFAATITNPALDGRFWSPSHFARSRGGPPPATAQEYIDSQKQPD